MSHWVLPQSGIPILVTTVQRVTNPEKQTDEMKKHMDNFQLSAQSRWDAGTSTVESSKTDQQNALTLENEDNDFIEEFNRVIKSEDLSDSNECHSEFGFDNWLNMEVGMDMEEHRFQQGTVNKSAIDADGKPIGSAIDNVPLDGCACKIEFSDGQTEILTDNIIAENLLAEVDAEGNCFLFMEEMEDHEKTADAIPRHEETFLTSCGIKRKKMNHGGMGIPCQMERWWL